MARGCLLQSSGALIIPSGRAGWDDRRSISAVEGGKGTAMVEGEMTEHSPRVVDLFQPLQVLFDRGPDNCPLPEHVQTLYGGGFGFDGPLLYANFVQSIDGVVSLRSVHSPAPEISGHSPADRFVMALLRAAADGVLVGAGTMRDTALPWTAQSVYPQLAADFARLRAGLEKPADPRLILVTASGEIDVGHPALAGAMVLTTDPGAAKLAPSLPPECELHVLPGDGEIDMAEALQLIRSQGLRYVLSEAGPNVTGQLVEAGLLDELFLTIAPVFAGGGNGDGSGLLEGIRMLPDRRESRELISVRRSDSYLFLRYGAPTIQDQPVPTA